MNASASISGALTVPSESVDMGRYLVCQEDSLSC